MLDIHELFCRVEHFSEKNHLIRPGERVMICISGGADSVCLTLYLLSVKEKYNLTLSCCHLNHLLREEADKEETFVREFCRDKELSLLVKQADTKQFASEKGMSIETAARELRYEFFRECAQKFNADKIAVAHNLTDSIETFMMNAYRGSGFRGLKGISPRKGSIVRPLLCLTSSEIRHAITEENVKYVLDESNDSLEFQRNRVRHIVIPSLYEVFDSEPEKGFERTMRHTHSSLSAMKYFIDYFLDQNSAQMGSTIRIKKEVFLNCSQDVLFEIVLRIIERLSGSTYYTSEVQLENIIRFCSKGESGYVSPFEKMDLQIARSLESIYFFKDFKDVKVNITGTEEDEVQIFPGVYCRIRKVLSPKPEAHNDRVFIRENEFPLVFEKIDFTHDNFQFSGSCIRNLKHFLKKRGIGQFEREHFPVLKSGHEIVWIPRVACSESFRETVFSGPFIEVYINDLLG